MEASGGYERSWAEALRKGGAAVRIVDPKRVRYFGKSAGRLGKTTRSEPVLGPANGRTVGRDDRLVRRGLRRRGRADARSRSRHP
jgi:transposase